MNSPAAPAPRRILIVIRQFHPLAAGAETQAARQAASYIKMGFPATVVTARHDRALAARDEIDGVPVERLVTMHARVLGSLVFLAALAYYLIRRAAQYDAVLVFQLKQEAALVSILCPLLGRRVVLSVQAAGELGDIQWLERAPFGKLILWCCRKAAAFVSGAGDITDELLRAGIPKARIHFIPNGIPVDAFAPVAGKESLRESLSLPARAFVAVNVGRHTAQKDLRTVLAAWREFSRSRPSAVLLLVGDGDERPQLEAFVRDNGLTGSVRFEGWRENVRDYLAASDVFASASLYEGTHIALCEAMAAGLPIIATPVGGARDYIRDGENGILIPVGNSRALAAALRRLASDPALRARMGRLAADTAQRDLSQEQTACRHLDLLFGRLTAPLAPRRVRITHLIATLDRGGTERQLAQLAAGMDRRVFANEVFCLTRGGPTADILDAAGIPHRVIGKRGKIDFFSLSWLTRRLFYHPPDVLHTWLFTSNLYGRLAAVLAGVGKVIVSERSTDPWKSPLHRAADRLLSGRTSRIVANSAAVARSLLAGGIKASRITVIPNGVDADRFHPMESRDARFVLGLSPAGPTVGFIGRLAYEKRPEVFLQVAKSVLAQMPESRAIIFGDGPMEESLKSQSWRLKDRLVFYGDCPFPELSHAALDCLVLTSLWEGFPNVVLEAMASGRPVVAVRMPATEELIEDGRTGCLVDDNAELLASAVLNILRDPALAAEMGRRGRQLVESRYSLDKMIKAYEQLYFEVIQAPTRSRGTV